ncbi:MAG: hypothetical protein LPK26_08865 [Bacillaceae bacterium]|nr:hypothetical protein [Bacillaceae bacterium]
MNKLQNFNSNTSDSSRRSQWEKVLKIFGITVVLLFAGSLLFMLLFGDGEQGHGGSGQGHGNGEMNHGGGGQGHGGGEMNHGGGGQGHGGREMNHGVGGTVPLLLLILTIGYLAILAVWLDLRRKWIILVRHVVSAAAMWILVALYLNAFGGFGYDIHSWNRAFANVSVVLYAVTLAIGPLARLWRSASKALEWRRETGIWATIAAVVHVGIFWGDRIGWAEWQRFFYPSLPFGGIGDISDTLMGDPSSGLFPSAFNLANVVGLAALVYALILVITSNDASQRWLKSGWSWIQKRATTMWLLVLLHSWLFAYYVTFGNALAIGTLWVSFWAVLLLQTAAFTKTVWLRRRKQRKT